ncbi:hypothetical protein SAMN02745116_02014 [Pilibacter termitis]|uniref:Uncharacterized protein n=1 Tax=Pilibacter termitis TaxID=263852 RepID=A0A1T4Q072_9ENTE|nr:hypothetical protein [Pilibacter termitis]SJZ97154.1 hypothetical protein SAMN02745116_02014 [Pilibacter termitis]
MGNTELLSALIREQFAYEQFKKLYQIKGVDYSKVIQTNSKDYLVREWTAKDYLSDIVYWHESFARNISDISLNRQPNVIRLSLREATKQGVDSNKDSSVSQLLRRLSKAQKDIESHVFNDKIDVIPYRKGSREYNRVEYLDIRTSEFNWHFWAVLQSMIKI